MKPKTWVNLRGVRNIRLIGRSGDTDFYIGERKIAPGFWVEIWFAGIPKRPETEKST